MSEKNTNYNASSIQVMEGLKAVRKRPAMYIGDTGARGLHHLVYEVVDNSIDEALAGYCSLITIALNADNSVTVSDNGRGIPVDMHPTQKKSALEVVLTVLHAGGKFDHQSYKVSGGLHGVGVSVVNALSDTCEVYVKRDGHEYYQKYKCGVPEAPVKKIRTCSGSGTTVTFVPDSEMFTNINFDYSILLNRFKELAFLNAGLRIILIDKRDESGKARQTDELYEQGGISSFVSFLSDKKNLLFKHPIHFHKDRDSVDVELALIYDVGYKEQFYSFVNNINTIEGGFHVSGFKTALTRTLNSYGQRNNLIKASDYALQGDDVREGLTAVLSVKVVDPQFEGQTKTKLGNSEVKGIVESVVGEYLNLFLEENPAVGRKIVEKCKQSAESREAARKARDLVRRKSALEVGGGLPGKLADCSSSLPEECELYIVEGDSAGGSAKQGRDRRFQAILPLRGKILNVEKTNIDKMLNNTEVRALITAIGVGFAETCDIQKARYHKIILMTDADIDGSHIRTLLLTFLYRYMRPLVENGMVYIAQPPLYLIKHGKQEHYAYNDKEKDNILRRTDVKGHSVQRYKGLGEMNPSQLWKTTMNPATRSLLRVTLRDVAEADKLFTILMGSDVAARRQFIEQNARYVRYLDI